METIKLEITIRKDKERRDSRIPEWFSQYAVVFDEASPVWSSDIKYNEMFLRQAENYLNDCLRTRGYLFLNKVHETLGMIDTIYGQLVGWIYDLENPIGDNTVQFEIFTNPEEKYTVIDFNVDGIILDRL